MGKYNALFVQRRGYPTSGQPTWETLCPTFRARRVTGLQIAQEIPGGFQEASFLIPCEVIRYSVDALPPYLTQVWVFEGTEPVYYGHVVQATPQENGDVQVSCDGPYRRLDDTRMRVVWNDSDVSQLPTAPGSTNVGSVTVDSNGDMRIAFAKGTPGGTGNYLDQGDYIAVDYFLFDEAAGTRDTKKVDGWSITIAGDSTYNQNAAFELRVYGLQTPNDSTPNLLQSFTTVGTNRQEISDASSGDNTTAWPSASGYRCIRVGLYSNAGVTSLGRDRYARITNLSFTTAGRRLGARAVNPGTGNPVTTTDVAKDIWTGAVSAGYDVSYLVQEESGTTGTNAIVTGNITDPGKTAVGMSFPAWSAPREILDAAQAIDGYKVGMWFPTKQPSLGSQTTSGSTAINYWYRQPARLVYEPWNDLGDPDYVVRLERGAQWVPDGQPDTLYSAAYVNYQTRKGRQQSVYVEDATTENRLYEQGYHFAPDWSVDPAVGSSLASSLGSQFVADARQPVLSGTLTIPGDRPGAIELPGGARITKLATLRPGVIRIVDADGAKAGRITRIDYSAATGGQPEQVVLTVNDPLAGKLDARLNRVARREGRSRHR